MFTQCPECDVAFRVTADVLRQAAGKVRCGRCGEAFNALEYLSEEKPGARSRPDPEPDLPELEPEADAGGDLEADKPPRFITAEQSAALLKTLDELAGEDIRIEDTGVEWRVIADGENGESDPFDEADPATAAADDDPDVDASEEMRFDDNTPLPDDFDFESAPVAPPEPAAEPPAADPAPGQVDLAFGDPDEWEDLLDEVAIDDAGTHDDEDEPDELAAAGIEVEEPGDLAEPDQPDAPGVEAVEAVEGDAPGEPHPAAAGPADESGDTSIEEDLIAAAFETEAAAREAAASGAFAALDEPQEAADNPAGESEEFVVDIPPEELAAEAPDLADDLPHEEVPSEVERELAAKEEELRFRLEDTGVADDVPAAEPPADDTGEDRGPDIDVRIDAWDVAAEPDFDLPEMSEEEQTINMMIDQDLLAIAVTDEEGFASTIVQKQPATDAAGIEALPDAGAAEAPASASAPAPAKRLVETIIMEGESFRGEGEEPPEAAGSVTVPPDDGDEHAETDRRRSIGLAAGVAALAVLLCLQVVHYSREALATVPAFNGAIAPLYRALGRPVSPDWDVSGWRFEATKGSAADDGGRLTIYSRIGNTAGDPLPLPLIRVSLTDRYQEVVGSRIVEPARYLVGDADPRETVAPGQNFSAVIGIESPAPEATGFTLNVCYRLASDKLRCAIEDFK